MCSHVLQIPKIGRGDRVILLYNEDELEGLSDRLQDPQAPYNNVDESAVVSPKPNFQWEDEVSDFS